VKPIIAGMKAERESLQAIADNLNAMGYTTLRGAKWKRMQVSRLIQGSMT